MKFNLIITSIIVCLSFLACEEAPTSIGNNLISDADRIKLSVIDSHDDSLTQTSSIFQSEIELSKSNLFHIGIFNEIKTTTAAKFFVNPVDSVRDYANADQIVILESWVEMVPKYVLGDSTSNLDFSVHKINAKWSFIGFDKDSLDNLQYDANDLSSNKSFSDSLIRFDMDPSAPLEWIKDRFDDNIDNNFGVVFLPKLSSQKIIGFKAVNLLGEDISKLYTVYSANGLEPDTLVTDMNIDVHVVESPVPSGVSNSIFVQAGSGVRSKLKFDLSNVPEIAVINNATLELKINELESIIGSINTDTLRINILAEAEGDSSGSFDVSLLKDGNSYTGDITNFIQLFNSGIDNHGFVLKSGNEASLLNRIAIFGSDATFEDRPKLKIYYSEIN